MTAICIVLAVLFLLAYALLRAQPFAKDDDEQMQFCEDWRRAHDKH